MGRALVLALVAGVISGVAGAYAVVKVAEWRRSYEASSTAMESQLELERVRRSVFSGGPSWSGRREDPSWTAPAGRPGSR